MPLSRISSNSYTTAHQSQHRLWCAVVELLPESLLRYVTYILMYFFNYLLLQSLCFFYLVVSALFYMVFLKEIVVLDGVMLF